MTRILVDLLFMTGRRGGMETYVRRVYERMGDLAPDIEWVALASRELAAAGAEWFPGDVIDSGIRSGSSAHWAIGEMTAVRRAVRRVGAAAVHAPANLGPPRAGAPMVLTVHDLLPFVHPEWAGSSASAIVLKTMIRRAVRGAARVVTVSEASAADIRSRLSPRVPIDVIPLAGSPRSTSARREARRTDLLFVPGNRMPHKDQATLLEAVSTLPGHLRPRVLVTGSRPDDPLRSLASVLGIADRVELVPWLDDDELDTAYASATAVVLPTRFEGFGLPVLEAMVHGSPVICSDLPALREVGGDAALYAEPGNPASFAAAIVRLLDDPALRGRMSSAGCGRATSFDWVTTARATLRVLRDAAGPA